MSGQRSAVEALAEDLCEYNPGHGDYLTAGRRLLEAIAADQGGLGARIEAVEGELLDWAEGRRSHLNEFMRLENSPENRQQTLIAVAQADAAEVQRLSAALPALRDALTACPEPA